MIFHAPRIRFDSYLGDYVENRVFIFGGRGLTSDVEHNPLTYGIEFVDGVLTFTSYAKNTNVENCANEMSQVLEEIRPQAEAEGVFVGTLEGIPTKNVYDTDVVRVTDRVRHEREEYWRGNFTCSLGLAKVAEYMNDLWEYDLTCDRVYDKSCINRGWRELERGMRLGGCLAGKIDCTHPTERYGHGGAIFDDREMAIYGGFSQMCDDYCADMWFWEIENDRWREGLDINDGARCRPLRRPRRPLPLARSSP